MVRSEELVRSTVVTVGAGQDDADHDAGLAICGETKHRRIQLNSRWGRTNMSCFVHGRICIDTQ